MVQIHKLVCSRDEAGSGSEPQKELGGNTLKVKVNRKALVKARNWGQEDINIKSGPNNKQAL